jgi:hypothetical protein
MTKKTAKTMNKKSYSTKKKSITKREANKAIKSIGMKYPDTAQNRKQIASALDDYLKTLRKRDSKSGKVKVTRKGKKAIKKAKKTNQKKR